MKRITDLKIDFTQQRQRFSLTFFLGVTVFVVLLFALGWGEITMPLRVFKQINVLKIAVAVGLVVGMTAATTPMGSAIF